MKTTIQERNGAVVFDLGMPKGNKEANTKVNIGRYQALMEEENDNRIFVRQDDIFG